MTSPLMEFLIGNGKDEEDDDDDDNMLGSDVVRLMFM